MEANIQKTYPIVLAASLGLLAALVTYLFQRNRIPTEWKPVGKVLRVHIYPLKSGRRKSLKAADCLKEGLQQTKEAEKVYQLKDRELIIYNAENLEFRTARTYPKMVRIEVNVHDENHLAIDAPGMRTLYVSLPREENATIVYVTCWYKEKIKAVDCGDEAANWLSRYILDKPSGVRMGYFPTQFRRDIETAHSKYLKYYKNLKNDHAGRFSDVAAIHLVNQASVDDLNARIGSSTISAENFRSNIIINTDPYAEDAWKYVKIGEDVILQVFKPCTRCILTTIDQESGVRNENGEPLKTLREYHPVENEELRKLENNAPVMGLNLGVLKTGTVHVGDDVYIPN